MNTAMPRVRVYPLCSECRAPYVLRHAIFVFDAQTKATPGKWVWQRDCKHKKALPLSSASPRVQATGTHADARSAKAGRKARILRMVRVKASLEPCTNMLVDALQQMLRVEVADPGHVFTLAAQSQARAALRAAGWIVTDAPQAPESIP